MSNVAAFRKGLNETDYAEGHNVTVEYHWLEGRYDRVPRRQSGSRRRQLKPGTVLVREYQCQRQASCWSEVTLRQP